jgi:Holliday junction resolvase-like predicted endonuclease
MTTYVTKLDGTREVYNEEKIKSSASRVGVPSDLQQAMLEAIRSRLYDGISTSEIFSLIKDYLHSSARPYLAMKYNLKTALAELGPSGYPFEKYVALLLAELGYTTVTNQILPGSCVTHEVDVVAEKSGITYYIEAKFHKSPNQRTDIRVALYIKARFDDLKSANTHPQTEPWIITNTRFSTDAIKYAECQGIKLTSWGYPKDSGIMDLIEKTRLHPVTMVEGLTKDDKLRLMTAGVVTARQLLDPHNRHLLSNSFVKNELPQVEQLCRDAS